MRKSTGLRCFFSSWMLSGCFLVISSLFFVGRENHDEQCNGVPRPLCLDQAWTAFSKCRRSKTLETLSFRHRRIPKPGDTRPLSSQHYFSHTLTQKDPGQLVSIAAPHNPYHWRCATFSTGTKRSETPPPMFLLATLPVKRWLLAFMLRRKCSCCAGTTALAV